MTVDDYATLAHETNRMSAESTAPLDKPMLGFFGEAGSLLSAVKKRTRDDIPADQYFAAVEEEVGDFLWYLSLVASVAGVPLKTIVLNAAKTTIRGEAGIRFLDVEKQFERKCRPSVERLIVQLIALSGDVGKFADWHAHNRKAATPEVVKGHLTTIMRGLMRACATAGITLQDAASHNLYKIHDRWPRSRDEYPDLPDATHEDVTERLPRKMEIRIEQRRKRGKPYVFQTCNDLNIGDPLTDNISDPDFYRFHDVFHYAYAAKLGWSPVMRALFKLKRKSDPDLDENQDGARAILIEEGLSTMIFNYAKTLKFFEGVKLDDLSFELLKKVREFVLGYEIERAPLWVWEEAILDGYACFRFLKTHKAGIVTIDLQKRTIDIKSINE